MLARLLCGADGGAEGAHIMGSLAVSAAFWHVWTVLTFSRGGGGGEREVDLCSTAHSRTYTHTLFVMVGN